MVVDPLEFMRLSLPSKGNRRRWRRHWFNGAIQVLTASRPIDGLGIQLSCGGMYLFAIADLAIGSEIKIAFREPNSGQPVQLRGTVRHRAVYLYGVEFLPEEYNGRSGRELGGRLKPSSMPSS